MVRPRQAQGRPGTVVIPPGWEAEHAKVVERTLTAECRVWPAKGAGSLPSVNADLSYDLPDVGEPLYEGPCRIQVLNAGDTQRVFGGEYETTRGYLVVLTRSSSPLIGRGVVVEVTAANDPTLLDDRRLVAAAVDRGSLLWERDLYCIDTSIPTT